MASTPFPGVLVLLLVAIQVAPPSPARAQVPAAAGHESLDGSSLRGRATGREAAGVWLLQHRRGNRPSFQPGVRLLALARVSNEEGGGGGQERDGNRRRGRGASVAVRIWAPKPGAARG